MGVRLERVPASLAASQCVAIGRIGRKALGPSQQKALQKELHGLTIGLRTDIMWTL